METPETEEELLLDTPVEKEPVDAEHGDEEETVLTFGDETEEKDDDTGLVKHLRAEVKRARQEAAEVRKSIPTPKPIEVGEKPTLEGCDWDSDKFEADLDAWKDRKAAAERQTATVQQTSEDQAKQWETRLAKIAEEKTALGKSDADEAFDTVKAALNDQQMAALIAVADEGNTAKLVYALGKHPDRLTALASQGDIIRFVKDVTKLEGQLKMVNRKKPPAPDTPERGSGRLSHEPADKQRKKIEDEARKTGDYTALAKYDYDRKHKR